MQAVLLGGVLRFLQALADGAPTILVGLIVAGVFRHLLGSAGTRRIFGNDTWRGLPQAWGWGMLLPVCSLGVIPIAYEMRRSGLSGGVILAFVLTAPLFNPLSLLYGLTLAAPIVIILFALFSLFIVTIIGLTWNRLCGDNALSTTDDDIVIQPGLRRIIAIGVVAARHISGPTLLYCAIGLMGSVLINFAFAKGSLTTQFGHDDPKAPLLMLVMALPAYATPLTVMSQLGSMFLHGNSVGAAFTLLTVGTGMNLGSIVWSWTTYGWKKTLLLLAMFLVSVLVIAYAVEKPLRSDGSVTQPHTHAFDGYCCPFLPDQPNIAADFQRKLAETFQPYQLASLILLAGLLLVGLALRIFDRMDWVDRYLEDPKPASGRQWDVQLPGPVLGFAAIMGLISLSVVGCYVYYPAPSEVLKEMTMTKADALSAAMSRDVAESIRQIERYDDLTRRLQIGYFIRHWKLDDFQRARAQVLRGRLEQLKDHVEAGEFDEARKLALKVANAHSRCLASF